MTKEQILTTIPAELIKQWDIKVDDPIFCEKHHLTINGKTHQVTSIDIESINRIDFISPLFIAINTKRTTTYITTHSNHTIILE